MDEQLNKDGRELLIQMRRVRIAYTGFLNRVLDVLGLNIPQYTALAILEEKGVVTMGALADALGITMGAVTNIVDRVIDKGWAARERGEDDRRVVRVQITSAGREVLEKAVVGGAEFVGSWLKSLTVEERRGFIGIYRRIAGDIESKGPGASS